MDMALLAVVVILIALAFEACNGFHDTAHACATVIGSKALSYKWAVVNSGFWNLVGALTTGSAVALFIPKMVHGNTSLHLTAAALLSALTWNLLTWWKSLPVSSTHCLIGSLVGAGIAAGSFHGIDWHEVVFAIASLFCAPLVGFTLAYGIGCIASRCIKPGKSKNAERWLHTAQIASSSALSFSHGSNDGQKTMGIITMVLAGAFGTVGSFSFFGLVNSHPYAAFLTDLKTVPWEVKIACAVCIGLGTIFGGRRVIAKVHKMSKQEFTAVDGCITELVAAGLNLGGGKLGLPLSTTQNTTGAIMGANSAVHGFRVIDRRTVLEIFGGWVFTFLVTPVVAAGVYWLISPLF